MELRRHGITANVFQSDAPHASDRYQADLATWLKGLPQPAAVMMAGDYHALNVFNACAKAHLSIPDDIAVLGVDNDPSFCETTTPALSSVEPPFENEGFEAARILDKLMRSRRESTRPIIVRLPPTRIVERESTSFVTPGVHLIDRAIKFIDDNCCSTISARDVSTRLGVSPALLANLFRQHERTTVRETIIVARMKKVCVLLKNTRLPIRRIAERCGFSTANRLTHFFTVRFGVSPRAFRESAARDSEERSRAP